MSYAIVTAFMMGATHRGGIYGGEQLVVVAFIVKQISFSWW